MADFGLFSERFGLVPWIGPQGVIDAAALGRPERERENADRKGEFDRFVVRRSPAGSE